MRATAGVAVPEEFYENGLKSTVQAPGMVARYGLDCFEYQCGYGVAARPPRPAKTGPKPKSTKRPPDHTP